MTERVAGEVVDVDGGKRGGDDGEGKHVDAGARLHLRQRADLDGSQVQLNALSQPEGGRDASDETEAGVRWWQSPPRLSGGKEDVIQALLTHGVVIVVALASVATVMGYVARRAWLCELASHFRVQYAWVLLAGATWLAVNARRSTALVTVGFALANLSTIAPLCLPRRARRSRRTFRVLLANVCFSNHAYESVRQFIRETNPDVVLLEEINRAWLAALKGLAAEYPSSRAIERRGGFGIALFSRLPCERIDVVRFGKVPIPSLVGRFLLDGQRLTVIGTHPWSPVSPEYTRLRNQHLEGLAMYVAEQPVPLIVLGDLNITSWSPVFQDLLRLGNLQDSRVGFGVQPTWPTAVPLARIPIDHCLVSSDVVVHRRSVGPPVGSDHYPIVVDVSLASDP